MRRLLIACGLACALVAAPRRARAEDTDVFARVTVAETEMRAGPGVSYRVIHRGHRGDTFLIQTRETSGYWLEVLLPDGRTAYVLGDTVEAMAVDEGTPNAPSKPGLFAPPALEDAHGGLALMGGAWNGAGYAEARPALVIAPAIAFEPYVGLALQSDSRRVIYGGAFALNLAPDWAIAPFFVLGAGGMHETPKDETLRETRNWFNARVGGGLLVSLRFRLLLRLEVSDFVLYTEDRYKNVQSYVGGLGSYF
ncbi:MAG TPA: SH3 domain-containing protein [Polyangiaceae bacterium]|nr:SH3 domain-containing protein [Polyangiaceae bacterium]